MYSIGNNHTVNPQLNHIKLMNLKNETNYPLLQPYITVEVLSCVAIQRIKDTELSLPRPKDEQTPVLLAEHSIPNGCKHKVILFKVLLQNITITCLMLPSPYSPC